MLSVFVTHHLASLLSWSGLPQGEDVATDWDFPPQAGFRVLAEAVAWVHHQHAVGGQTIHLTVLHPPLGCLLLWRHKELMFPLSPKMTESGLRTEVYPEEDVLGGVEPRSADPCWIRRVSLADDAAGETGDGALNCLTVCIGLTTRHRVCHHKVNGTLCRTANL